MKAAIISIGDELLKGEICNTNAVYISRDLQNIGIDIRTIINLPDNIEDSRDIIRDLIKSPGIYIFTGGLGGTKDDITRKIIEEVLNRRFVISGDKDKELREWYKKRGREYREEDRAQASFPEGGSILDNNVGLACGFYIRFGNRYIFALPGVPAEMRDMFKNEVIPILLNEGLVDNSYSYEFLTFADIPEYTLDAGVSKIVSGFDSVEYGTRSKSGIIRIRFESFNREELQRCVEKIIDQYRDYLIYRGEHSIEEELGRVLFKKNLKISFAESLTGGYLSKVVTDISGASRYFLGSVVSYSDFVKNNILNVKMDTLKKYSAVSHKTAVEMARGIVNLTRTDIGISLTGIAGPTGGTKETPVGTVFIGWYDKNERCGAEEYHFKGDREEVRIRSVNRALIKAIKIARDLK